MNLQRLASLALTSTVLLPYARSQTLSGAPAKASIASAAVTPAVTTATATNVTTTTGGTKGTIPMFTTSNNIENSTLYYNATGLGIGRFPGGMLDVNGKAIIRGSLDLSRLGDATASTGYPSNPFFFQSSVYNSTYKASLLPYFQIQSEPAGNDTASTGATMNFLYYSGVGGAGPQETGLYVNPNGVVHFAPAQTFPITTGATGPAGPQGPAGPTGPQGPIGPTGPAGSVPANLTALSGQLSTTSGVAYLGSDRFEFPGSCVIGDVFLSVNGYGSGNALPADGRLIPIQNNTALFSLIGVNFGGNGTSNYALPDLRAFAPKGMQYSICLNGIFPSEN